MNKAFNRMISIITAMFLSFVCLAVFPVRYTADSVGGAEMDPLTAAETMAARFNEEREKLGYQPLKIVPYLNEIAQTRANEIVTHYSHTRPDGSEVDTLINTDIADFSWCGEVLGRGTYNIESMLNAWRNSNDRHWEFITKPTATHVGVAVVYAPDHPKKWLWAALIFQTPYGEDLPDQRWPLEEAIVPKYCGDVTGDGMIDSFDLVMLSRYLNNEVYFNTAQVEASDIFDDDVVTTADVSALRKYILGEYDKLPITLDMLI